jgi:hypothetical protein
MIGRSLMYFWLILLLYSNAVVPAAHTSIHVTGLAIQGALDKPLDLDRLLAIIQQYCPSTPPPWRDGAVGVKRAP